MKDLCTFTIVKQGSNVVDSGQQIFKRKNLAEISKFLRQVKIQRPEPREGQPIELGSDSEELENNLWI